MLHNGPGPGPILHYVLALPRVGCPKRVRHLSLSAGFAWRQQRLRGIRYPDGTTISNFYSDSITPLDLTAIKDRLGHWTYFGYNPVRQKIAETNANGVMTGYGYCDCGALLSVTNAWQTGVEQFTLFNYDFQGNRINSYSSDGYNVTNWYWSSVNETP